MVPNRTPLITDFHLDAEELTTPLWMWLSNQFFILPAVHTSNPNLYNSEIFWGPYQRPCRNPDDVHSSSLVHWCSQLYKATDLVLQDLPLVNWCWLPQIIWSSAFTTYSASWENIVLQGSSMSILILELHCLDFFLLRANAVTLLHNRLNSQQTRSSLL